MSNVSQQAAKEEGKAIPKSLYGQIVDALLSELESKQDFKGLESEVGIWMLSAEKDPEKLTNTLTTQKSDENH